MNNSASWRVDTSTPSFVPETAVIICCSLIAEWLSDGFVVIVLLCFFFFLSGIIRQCQICQNACNRNVWCAYMDSVHVWSEHFITHTLRLWINWRLLQHLRVIHTTWPRGSASLCGIRYVKIQSSWNGKVRHVKNCFEILMPVTVWDIMTHHRIKIAFFTLSGDISSLACYVDIHMEPYCLCGVSTGFDKL